MQFAKPSDRPDGFVMQSQVGGRPDVGHVCAILYALVYLHNSHIDYN